MRSFVVIAVGVILIGLALWMHPVEGFADDAAVVKYRCREAQSFVALSDNYKTYNSCNCSDEKNGTFFKPDNFKPNTKYVASRCEHACFSDMITNAHARTSCPQLF